MFDSGRRSFMCGAFDGVELVGSILAIRQEMGLENLALGRVRRFYATLLPGRFA